MNDKNTKDLKTRSFIFSINIIKFIKRFPKSEQCYIINDQIIRSATSIGANIFEAKSSSSRRDFIRFFTIALKSANETKYWLGILKNTTKSLIQETNELLSECKEMANMLAASLITAKKKRC